MKEFSKLINVTMWFFELIEQFSFKYIFFYFFPPTKSNKIKYRRHNTVENYSKKVQDV